VAGMDARIQRFILVFHGPAAAHPEA